MKTTDVAGEKVDVEDEKDVTEHAQQENERLWGWNMENVNLSGLKKKFIKTKRLH